MNEHRQPTTDTRTAHRLDLPAHLCDTGDAALRRALYVEREATSLSVEHDQAVERALPPVTYAVGDPPFERRQLEPVLPAAPERNTARRAQRPCGPGASHEHGHRARARRGVGPR